MPLFGVLCEYDPLLLGGTGPGLLFLQGTSADLVAFRHAHLFVEKALMGLLDVDARRAASGERRSAARG